jgi:hypothetical protein
VASDETKARRSSQTNNGHCRRQVKPDLIVINDCKIKTRNTTSRDAGNKSNVTSQGKLKQSNGDNCDGPRRSKGIAAVTKRMKSAPRATAIGVLAKKLRSLSLPGNTKSIFVPQYKVEQQQDSDDIHGIPINRLSSHVSIESGKSTISDSSLQDLDETEFVGEELVRYMGQLNEQRLVL